MSEAKNLELELKLKGIDALILNKTCSPAFGAINLYDHSPQPLFAPDIRLGSGGLFLIVKESDKGERSIVKSREPI
jgi:hypothetical protein